MNTNKKENEIKNIVNNNIYGNNNPVNIASGQTVNQTGFSFSLETELSELLKLGLEKQQVSDLAKIFEENKTDKATLSSKIMKWIGSVSSSVAAKGLSDNIPAIVDFIHKHILI